MANEVTMRAPAPLGDVAPVSGSTPCTFSVDLIELNGTCQIKYSEDYPASVQLAVALYVGAPPSNPSAWDFAQQVADGSGIVNTNKNWGKNWSAALLGMGGGKSWIYVAKTPVTT